MPKKAGIVMRSEKQFNITSIKYYITEAARGIARNFLMAISSASCVAACIFIVVLSVCAMINIDYFLSQIENTAGISVFLDKTMNEDEIMALYDEIKAIEHVKQTEDGVVYVSQQEALESMGDSDEARQALQGFAADNPLPPSFTVRLDDIRYQEKVVDYLNSANIFSRGITEVKDSRTVTDILININKVVRIISVFIILILGLLSVVIIMNTIKITVNSRKNEIKIMKYVGATNWFIKCPFMLEGIVIGIFGALLPVVIGALGYEGVVKMVIKSVPKMISLPDFKTVGAIFPILAPVLLVIGACLGAAGSLSSMKKHLDV